MIQITTVSRRLAATTPFSDPSVSRAAIDAHITTTYKDTKQLISEAFVISADKLSSSYTVVWDTKAHHDAFLVDPVMTAQWAAGKAYQTANGITFDAPVIVTI